MQSPNSPGSLLALSTTNCGGASTSTGYDNVKSWQPEAAVGAGAASAASGQLVNFNQFGRCLDVPNQNISYVDPNGTSYLIIWPCKQAPVATNVAWNQRWALPGAGIVNGANGSISTNYANAGTLYCLQSPLSTASGKYVFEEVCPKTLDSSVKWTVYRDTGSYSTSYVIKDSSGYCLQPTDPTVDYFPQGNGISKSIVAVCNGSTLQKWNAPANLLSPTPLKDIGETQPN